MSSLVRLVLKDPQQAIALETIADEEGWTVNDAVEASDESPLEIVWTTADDVSVVRYIEDQFAGFAYIQVEGPDAETRAKSFAKRFAIWSPAEVANVVHHPLDKGEAARGAMLAGLTAPRSPTAESLALIEHNLAHPDPTVRERAVQASAYPAWPELLPKLDEMADSDPNDGVRRSAGRLAAILRGGAK